MKGKVDAEKRDRLLSKLYERAIIYGKDLACPKNITLFLFLF